MDAGFSDFFYTVQDGLRLHARIYGEGLPGLPVVCLPGLTRNVRDFHELALYLSAGATPRKVVAFDYRGRGQSAYDPDWKKYDVGVETGDIVQGLMQLGIAEAAFIGTSRGGLILHVLAMVQPKLLKAVVLNDIGPAVEGAGLAFIRSYLENATAPATLDEAVAAQRAVHGAAFPALSDKDWLSLVGGVYRIEEGKAPVPDFDPALLNGIKNFSVDTPLPTLWPQFEALKSVPVLAIRGENSLLLSAATLQEMANRHPDIETITVAGQGHAPLLETGELPQRIAAFVNRVAGKAVEAAG